MSARQHLSDEAVAACADGALGGHATDRAVRHLAECAECAAAVRTQREVTFALRTAPAPALPTDLLDRLRGLPATTPVDPAPTIVTQDGTTMLSTSSRPLPPASAPAAPSPLATTGFPTSSTPFGAAAFVAPADPHPHRGRGFLGTTAAVVALVGAIAVGSAVSATEDTTDGDHPSYVNQLRPAYAPAPDGPVPDTLLRQVTPFGPNGR